MKKLICGILVFIISISFSGCAKEELNLSGIKNIQPKGSVYLKGTEDKALILAHGKGTHPESNVVNPLRKSIHSELGYHTLSLQMPNSRNHWKEYSNDFPKAYNIIKQAIVFLQNKGVKEIYLMGHSMGSRMMSSFLSEHVNTPIKGLIIVGCRNNGGYPLSCVDNVRNIKNVPVLDIWGGLNNADTKAATGRKYLISHQYKQISIDGANHRLDNYDRELNDEIVKWLTKK